MTLSELELLASGATQGDWWYGNCDPADGHALAWVGNWFVDCVGGQRNYGDQEKDAKYIAAVNPETIKNLISLCRLQHAALGKTMGVWGGTCAWHKDVENAMGEFESFGLPSIDKVVV